MGQRLELVTVFVLFPDWDQPVDPFTQPMPVDCLEPSTVHRRSIPLGLPYTLFLYALDNSILFLLDQ